MSRNAKADRKRAAARRKAQRAARDADRCTDCGKRLYPNQNAALNAIASSGAGCRVYEAHGGWHVTSKRKAPSR